MKGIFGLVLNFLFNLNFSSIFALQDLVIYVCMNCRGETIILFDVEFHRLLVENWKYDILQA